MTKLYEKEKIKSTNSLSSKMQLKPGNNTIQFAENIINTIREPLLLLDKDLRVLNASRSFCDLFQVSSDETVGTLIYNLGNHQWNIPKLKELLETILHEKTTFDDFEVEHDFSDIGNRIMLLNARQIERAIGQEKIILLAIEDITERKRTEKALKTSEELFRVASESLTDIVFDWDIKEKIDWYGDIDGLMGYPPGEFPRTLEAWAVSIHPEDKDRVMAALKDYLKGIMAHYIIEYRVKRRDGNHRWWSVRGTALRDDRGEPYKMIGSITDITERKMAEEALRASKKIIEGIINSIPVRVFWKDKNLVYLGCNKIFANDAGFTDPKEIIGKDDYQMGMA